MDKSKDKMNEWTDSDDSSSAKNIGPLKKPRVDYDALIKEKDREIEYWRNAYIEQRKLNMDYIKRVREEMDKMEASHQSQMLNLRNSRLYFDQLRRNLVNQLKDVFQQISDSFLGMEQLAQDYVRDIVVPKYEEPKEPSMPTLGGESASLTETCPMREGMLEAHPCPTMSTRNPRKDGSGPSRIRRTPRKRTLPTPPPFRTQVPEEDAMASVERYLGLDGNGVVGDKRGDRVDGNEGVHFDDESEGEGDTKKDSNN